MNNAFMVKLLAILLLVCPPSVQAEETYVDNLKCYGCHKIPMQTFKAAVHGRAFSGEVEAGCQSCHGPGAAHIEIAGEGGESGELKIESFKNRKAGPAEQNRPCLNCHGNKKTHANWAGSAHDMGGLRCADCHNLHVAGDTVKPGICFTCHQTKRAQVNHTRNPMMPRADGGKECARCHDAHGSGKGPGLLKAASVNETCYGCHSEKRGPFLWEHAPVRENCANCHDPHGTANANFLKIRPPYLCQNCHSEFEHPSMLYGAQGLTGSGGNAETKRLIGKSCLNCHGLIHGSNHPSGARFQR